jgi:hypothetical protein
MLASQPASSRDSLAGAKPDERARKSDFMRKKATATRSRTKRGIHVTYSRAQRRRRSNTLEDPKHDPASRGIHSRVSAIIETGDRSLSGGGCRCCCPVPLDSSKDRDRLTCWIRASGSLTPVVCISENTGQCDNFADVNLDEELNKLLSGIKDLLNQAVKNFVGEGDS